MLREVGKIYARAFRMIFQYPSFWRLSIGYFFADLFVRVILFSANRNLPTWKIFWSLLNIGRSFVYFCVPMIFILMVFQSENEFDQQEIFRKVRLNFWKFVGQSLVGLLIVFLYTLPVFCLLMFAIYSEGMLLIAPFWFLVIGFLSMGSVTIAERILLDKGGGLFQNATTGLRMLNENLRFFTSIYFVEILIWAVLFVPRVMIGSLITGVDIFSVPLIQFSDFYKNLILAIDVPWMTIIYKILNFIIFPLNVIVPTLAYLRCKTQVPSPEPSTEN